MYIESKHIFSGNTKINFKKLTENNGGVPRERGS